MACAAAIMLSRFMGDVKNHSRSSERKFNYLTWGSMKKIIFFWAVFSISSVSLAFQGDLQFKRTTGGVAHSAKLSNWRVDKKGVPSFDYVYEQSGPGCGYRSEGKAIAGFDEYKGKIELEIYNPEDAKGRETGQILIFYNNDISMTLQLKESMQNMSFSFVNILNKDELARSCLKKTERLSVSFGKAVK